MAKDLGPYFPIIRGQPAVQIGTTTYVRGKGGWVTMGGRGGGPRAVGVSQQARRQARMVSIPEQIRARATAPIPQLSKHVATALKGRAQAKESRLKSLTAEQQRSEAKYRQLQEKASSLKEELKGVPRKIDKAGRVTYMINPSDKKEMEAFNQLVATYQEMGVQAERAERFYGQASSVSQTLQREQVQQETFAERAGRFRYFLDPKAAILAQLQEAKREKILEEASPELIEAVRAPIEAEKKVRSLQEAKLRERERAAIVTESDPRMVSFPEKPGFVAGPPEQFVVPETRTNISLDFPFVIHRGALTATEIIGDVGATVGEKIVAPLIMEFPTFRTREEPQMFQDLPPVWERIGELKQVKHLYTPEEQKVKVRQAGEYGRSFAQTAPYLHPIGRLAKGIIDISAGKDVQEVAIDVGIGALWSGSLKGIGSTSKLAKVSAMAKYGTGSKVVKALTAGEKVGKYALPIASGGLIAASAYPIHEAIQEEKYIEARERTSRLGRGLAGVMFGAWAGERIAGRMVRPLEIRSLYKHGLLEVKKGRVFTPEGKALTEKEYNQLFDYVYGKQIKQAEFSPKEIDYSKLKALKGEPKAQKVVARVMKKHGEDVTVFGSLVQDPQFTRFVKTRPKGDIDAWARSNKKIAQELYNELIKAGYTGKVKISKSTQLGESKYHVTFKGEELLNIAASGKRTFPLIEEVSGVLDFGPKIYTETPSQTKLLKLHLQARRKLQGLVFGGREKDYPSLLEITAGTKAVTKGEMFEGMPKAKPTLVKAKGTTAYPYPLVSPASYYYPVTKAATQYPFVKPTKEGYPSYPEYPSVAFGYPFPSPYPTKPAKASYPPVSKMGKYPPLIPVKTGYPFYPESTYPPYAPPQKKPRYPQTYHPYKPPPRTPYRPPPSYPPYRAPVYPPYKPPTTRKPPKIPPLLGPPVIKEKKKKMLRKNELGFMPWVKKFGKWVPISKEPLTRESAFKLGALRAASSPRASFRVRPLGLVSSVKELAGLPSLPRGMFRKPIRKGKEVQASDVWIEKTQFRIDKPGELFGITYKGIAARKRNRLLASRLF